MAEDVTAFVSRVGLQTALEILGEDVWKYTKFSFEQWDNEYCPGINDPELETKILAKMVEAASVTEHWLRIWNLMAVGNPLRSLVTEKIKEGLQMLTTFDQVQKWQPQSFRLDFDGKWKELNAVWPQRLAELAVTLEDWKYVLYEGERTKNADLVTKALEKMVECAKSSGTADDWQNVYYKAAKGSEAMRTALYYFFTRAKTNDDWFDLWYKARDKDDDWAQLAWQKTIDSAKTFEQWHTIFSHSKEDAVRERCIGQFIDLATDFHEWLCLYQANEKRAQPDEKLRVDASEKMRAKAKNVDDWLRIWHQTPEGSEAKAKALKWLRDFVKME